MKGSVGMLSVFCVKLFNFAFTMQLILLLCNWMVIGLHCHWIVHIYFCCLSLFMYNI